MQTELRAVSCRPQLMLTAVEPTPVRYKHPQKDPYLTYKHPVVSHHAAELELYCGK